MGVTIHFEGRLRSKKTLAEVCFIAGRRSARWNCEAEFIDEESKTLSRVKNEEDWDYVGPVVGVQLQPHPNTDPLILEFDKDLYVQEFCKTQFAPPSVHVEVVQLLKEIAVHYEVFTVDDEGEFWETGDEQILVRHRHTCEKVMEEMKAEDPGLIGPVRTKDRRIQDLISPTDTD